MRLPEVSSLPNLPTKGICGSALHRIPPFGLTGEGLFAVHQAMPGI
jgi:hypothetical protein